MAGVKSNKLKEDLLEKEEMKLLDSIRKNNEFDDEIEDIYEEDFSDLIDAPFDED
ncbi:MAG: hypothetical protein QW727_03585 [Candidatus Pacearchaeota archaeon]